MASLISDLSGHKLLWCDRGMNLLRDKFRLLPAAAPAISRPASVATPGEIAGDAGGGNCIMLVDACIDQVLADARLTLGLEDPEARLLVEWLVDQAEKLPSTGLNDAEQDLAWSLCYRRAKVLRQFVRLWCYRGRPEAAIQLAASEGLADHLPDSSVEEAPDVMLTLMKPEPFRIV
jgi:hypothetical protein